VAELADEIIPTRATLLERLKDWQDDSSWRDFVSIYEKLILGVAVNAGLTHEEAQDVLQETMATVSRQMPGFKYDPKAGSFKSWLLHTTRWRIADLIRKRDTQATTELPSEDTSSETWVSRVLIDPSSPDMDALWEIEWKKNILAAAVAKVKRRVDPQKFQIFDLCMNKGWAPEKVAQAFSISIDQVYLDKSRVTEKIREEIEKCEAVTI
jgi:RNA polymerase sigma-70 factor (ECF subfamily)